MIRRAAGVVALGAATGAASLAYGYFLEPRWLRTRRLQVDIPTLPDYLDGLTILHLSDLHYRRGHRISTSLLRRTGDWARDMRPDLVCYTGDFIETDADIDACLDLLGPVHGTYGTLAVFGNHDYSRKLDRPEPRTERYKVVVAEILAAPWKQIQSRDPVANTMERIAIALCQHGISLLQNTSTVLDIAGGSLCIVGVDDPHQDRDDLSRALRCVPRDMPVLMLAHSYDIVPDLLRTAPPMLLLAGHTHGGQVRLPLLPPILTHTRVQLKDARGLIPDVGFPLHVSPGIGSSIPFRFGCRPEATVLRLRRPTSPR